MEVLLMTLFDAQESAIRFAAMMENSYNHVTITKADNSRWGVEYCCPLNPDVAKLPRFQNAKCQLLDREEG